MNRATLVPSLSSIEIHITSDNKVFLSSMLVGIKNKIHWTKAMVFHYGEINATDDGFISTLVIEYTLNANDDDFRFERMHRKTSEVIAFLMAYGFNINVEPFAVLANSTVLMNYEDR
jgi:hypothetical protein